MRLDSPVCDTNIALCEVKLGCWGDWRGVLAVLPRLGIFSAEHTHTHEWRTVSFSDNTSRITSVSGKVRVCVMETKWPQRMFRWRLQSGRTARHGEDSWSTEQARKLNTDKSC
jgi:hypothetical protein